MSNLYTLQLALDTGVSVSPGLSRFSADAGDEVATVKATLESMMLGAQVGLDDKKDFNLNDSLKDFREVLEDSIVDLKELSGVEAGGPDPFEDPAAAPADAPAAAPAGN